MFISEAVYCMMFARSLILILIFLLKVPRCPQQPLLFSCLLADAIPYLIDAPYLQALGLCVWNAQARHWVRREECYSYIFQFIACSQAFWLHRSSVYLAGRGAMDRVVKGNIVLGSE